MEKKFFEKPAVFVGEVHIKVMNLNRALGFYQEIIGFDVLEQSERKAILTADGRTPLLILEQPEDVVKKENRTAGLYHFALLLPNRSDLSRFLRHLLTTGYRFGASDHYVSEALYISDPDGNGIEVYRDRPSADWSWMNGEVAMATEPLNGESLLAESEEAWTRLPAGTVMGHIHLHVSDLQRTEKFYTQGLGFNIVTRYPGALFASTGGYHHHIGLNVWNGVGAPAPAPNSVGLNWFTLVFPDEAARAGAIASLERIGANVEKESGHVIAVDPSGNRIRMEV